METVGCHCSGAAVERSGVTVTALKEGALYPPGCTVQMRKLIINKLEKQHPCLIYASVLETARACLVQDVLALASVIFILFFLSCYAPPLRLLYVLFSIRALALAAWGSFPARGAS